MQITDLRGRLYKARKSRHGGDRKSSTKKTDLKSQGRVTEQIANELGVNRDTILKAGNFVDGLDKADSVVPGFKDGVLTGAIKAQKQEVAKMRKQTPEEIKKSVKEIEERKKYY